MLWAVLGGLFATSFSITILAVSLGDIARDLGSSKSALTWTITGPFLALAICMPLFGKLGDLYGHRRLYLLGLSGFTIATVLTAFAWSGPSLIAFRVLGGIPAAAVGPASMAIIMRAFPGRDRVKAMSWWSFVGAAGPVTGLIAGGPLVDALGWRWVFIVQAPLALLGLAVAVMVVRETPRAPAEPIDWAGAGSLATASFMLLLALSLTGDLGWTSPVVIGLAVAALVALWSFVRVELRARHPLVPLDLFRRHNFR
ncbi:MAG: MFS transporter, partial [Actinobacteria bacterium]